MTKRDRGGYALATAFFIGMVWSEHRHHQEGITDSHWITMLASLVVLLSCWFLSEYDARRARQ